MVHCNSENRMHVYRLCSKKDISLMSLENIHTREVVHIRERCLQQLFTKGANLQLMETLSAFALPPGFGFHPTDVELISHYLKRKILGLKIDYEVIPEVDIYKCEPWDLPAKCHIPTRDSKWHFFTSRDRKYPNGSRTNRATEAGYWKSTGRDRNIKSHNRVIGTKKTLVFHEGRPPCGKRTDWIMHEYYMDENECKAVTGLKDIFVLCRVTKRDGLPFDCAFAPPKTEIDTSSKPPNDVAVPVVQEESSSPSEKVDDLDAWFNELYDPDFCTIPTIDERKSESKISQEEFSSLALKQEPTDFNPNFSEGLHLSELGEDIRSTLQSDTHDLNSDVFGDAASGTWWYSGLSLDDLSSPKRSTQGYMDYYESSFISRNDNKFAASDSTPSTQPDDNIDAGIQIRDTRSRPTDLSSSRSRFKMRTMEMKNHLSVNHTVQFVNHERHLDLNYDLQCLAIVEKEENQNSAGITYSEVNQSDDPSCLTASKTSEFLVSGATTLRKTSTAGPLDEGKFSPTHSHETSCIQGLMRGLCMFLRRCSSTGLNCFFLVACMVGTAAVILYFMPHGPQSVLGSFSALGL